MSANGCSTRFGTTANPLLPWFSNRGYLSVRLAPSLQLVVVVNTADEASEAGVKGLVQVRVEAGGAQAPKAITDGLSSQQIEDVMTACDAQEVCYGFAPVSCSVSIKTSLSCQPCNILTSLYRVACWWVSLTLAPLARLQWAYLVPSFPHDCEVSCDDKHCCTA